MPTDLYPVMIGEPSFCFGCHERKAQHQIQMNASEFNECPSKLSLVNTGKRLQTPFLSNPRALCWKHWSGVLYYQYKILDGSVWRLCLSSGANESCSRLKLPVKFSFIPSMAAEKLCIVLVDFFYFITVTLYLSPSPSAAVAGAGASMTLRWRTSIRGTLCFLALCTVRCTSVGSSTAPAPGSVMTWM